MKRFLLLLTVTLLAIFSCKTRNTKELQPTAVPPPPDTSKFYPLDVFFKEQIDFVELRNFSIYRVTVKDGKKDSSGISKEQFIALADIFLKRDIADPKVKVLYRETAFQDLSTASITLNYVPVNNNEEVQNIDVLLDEATHLVKRVFIRSVFTRNDTIINEQCNWKADKSFQVNRSATAKDGHVSTELNYINWNDKP